MINKLLFALMTLQLPLAAGAQSSIDSDSTTSRQKTVDTSIVVEDVVVTGTRGVTPARLLPTPVTVVNADDLQRRQNPNVLPALSQEVPGLFVTQRGMMGYGVSGGAAGGISLRGLSSGNGQVLVLIDGHPQYQGVFGHSISDSYQTLMAERIQVVRGPASVIYGSNAMGGVVNIITHSRLDNGHLTTARLGGGSHATFQADLLHQVRKDRLSATIAANYGRSDNHRPRMGFEQYGSFAKMDYSLSHHWKSFIDVDLTHFNASNPGSEASPLYEADQWITRGVATMGVDNSFDNANGRISIYDNFGRHKVNDGHAPEASPQTELFRSKDALAGISAYENFQLDALGTLSVGADYQHIYGRAYYTSRETGEIVTTGRRGKQSTHTHCNEIAAYANALLSLTDRMTVNAGARIDHHTVAGTEVIPQGGVVVSVLSNANIRALVSKGFRNPSVKEMFLYGTANHDSLRAERAINYEISWSQQGQHIENDNGDWIVPFAYGVNLFIFKGDNMIQTIGGKNINTGEFENRGLEIEASMWINNHVRLSTNHSFLHQDKPLVGTPTYKGFLGADLHTKRFGAHVGIQHVADLYKSIGENEQTEDFTMLDISANYNITPSLSLWAKGENLLAQKYELVTGWPMPRATVMAGVRVAFHNK